MKGREFRILPIHAKPTFNIANQALIIFMSIERIWVLLSLKLKLSLMVVSLCNFCFLAKK